MKVLLDTNVVSVYINGRSSTLRDKLKTVFCFKTPAFLSDAKRLISKI